MEQNSVNVYNNAGEYLGQIEPKLARRLTKLMCGGNKYDAAHPRHQRPGHFHHSAGNLPGPAPSTTCAPSPAGLRKNTGFTWGDDLVRYIGGTDLEDDDEPAIDEEAMDTEWNDGE